MTDKLEYYTRPEVCKLLGIDRQLLKRLLDNGEIKGFKLGRRIVILKTDYVRFIGGSDE